MKDKEAKDLIMKAIINSSYRWRTPRGIAKDARIPLSKVITLLEKGDDFLRAHKSNNNGEPLYTTKEKRQHETNLVQRILSVISNRVID
jgi:hypothetical protein